MIRLTKREKLLALALAVFTGGWGLYALAVKPALERTTTLGRVISEKQVELEKLRAKSSEYISLSENLSSVRKKVASQEKGFELLPFLETMIREQGLASKVAAMKQRVLQLGTDHSDTVVEVRLENLTLRQIIDFLQKVESSNVLAKTKSLYIKKNITNMEMLDSIIEIHNPKLSQI